MRRWKRSLHPVYPVYNHLSWWGRGGSIPAQEQQIDWPLCSSSASSSDLQARQFSFGMVSRHLFYYHRSKVISNLSMYHQLQGPVPLIGSPSILLHTEVAHFDIDEMLWQSLSSSDLCRIAEATFCSTTFSAFYLLFTASYYLATGSLPSCQSSFSSCHSSNSADSPAVFPTWTSTIVSLRGVVTVSRQF